jgi:hypothetical protein
MSAMTTPKPRKKKDADAKRERVGRNINVWLNAELVDAFQASRRKFRRTNTGQLEVILEEYLKREGFLSPDWEGGTS